MFTPPQNRLRAGLPDPLADRPHEAGAGCGSSRHGRLGKGAGPQGRKPTQRTLNHDTHPKSMGLEPKGFQRCGRFSGDGQHVAPGHSDPLISD